MVDAPTNYERPTLRERRRQAIDLMLSFVKPTASVEAQKYQRKRAERIAKETGGITQEGEVLRPQFLGGVHIRDAAEMAWDILSHSGKPVSFTFNGVEISLRPTKGRGVMRPYRYWQFFNSVPPGSNRLMQACYTGRLWSLGFALDPARVWFGRLSRKHEPDAYAFYFHAYLPFNSFGLSCCPSFGFRRRNGQWVKLLGWRGR